MADSIRLIASPLCIIPGISSSHLCDISQGADYPTLVAAQSRTFDQLLDDTASGSGLSLEIKKAEMATNDLVTLVRVSDLKSRDLLASTLIGFVEEARKTSRGLQKFTSKVGSAVDR